MDLFHIDNDIIMAQCREFADRQIDLQSYAHFSSVKHYQDIINFCQQVPLVREARMVCVAVLAHNNELFYTFDDPYVFAGYRSTGLYRADNFFLQAMNCGSDVMFATDVDNSDLMRCLVYNVFRHQFALFNAYCLIRRCDDCAVVISITANETMENPKQYYQQSYQVLEQFTIDYLSKFLSLYAENLSSIRYSRFILDDAYRARVIRNEYHNQPPNPLTARETECLYWLSLGKTARETATLMNISEYTIIEYKKKILQKLNASNITHAVRMALQLGILS